LGGQLSPPHPIGKHPPVFTRPVRRPTESTIPPRIMVDDVSEGGQQMPLMLPLQLGFLKYLDDLVLERSSPFHRGGMKEQDNRGKQVSLALLVRRALPAAQWVFEEYVC